MVRSRRSRPFDTIDADLRLALAKVLGYLSLWFGDSRDADRTLNGDALGIVERPRREIPEAIEGVSTFVVARTGSSELVQRFDDFCQLLPTDPWELQELRPGEGGDGPNRRQACLSQGRPQRFANWKFLHRLRRVAQIGNEGRLGSRRNRGGSRDASAKQRLLERDDVVGRLRADRVNRSHLRGR